MKSNTRDETSKYYAGCQNSLACPNVLYEAGEKMKKSLRVPAPQEKHLEELRWEN